VEVVKRIPVKAEPNPENQHYLETKKAKMGHLLNLKGRIE
jgi:GTP cyclohydrolase II